MEAAEGNVLAPVDAGIDCARHQVERGVLVDEVLEALSGAKQKIVVLDACRNDPLGQICPPATKAKLTFRDFKIPDAGNFLVVSSTEARARSRMTACPARIRPLPARCSPRWPRRRTCISTRCSTASPRP